MISKKKEKTIVEQIRARIEADPQQQGPMTFWFDAPIDHFDNHGAASPTYRMRYLVNVDHYTEKNGPIIFYTGNEGDIWTFYENSGFMRETLAKQFGAVTVWAEHRYFGESMPFGKDSF